MTARTVAADPSFASSPSSPSSPAASRGIGGARLVITLFTAAALAVTLVLGMVFSAGTADAQDAGLTVGATAYVGTDVLNLRADASVSADILATYPTNAAVTVVDGPVEADGYVWYGVEVDGVTGWMVGSYLASSLDGAAALYAAELGTATTTSTTAIATGYAAGASLTVVDDDVNVRAAAGLSADVIGTLASGTVAVVVSGPESLDGYAWYGVTVDGVTGYVAADYLGDASAVEAVSLSVGGSLAAGSSVAVTADGVNLRAAAGLDGTVLDTLSTGETAMITGASVSADGYIWYPVVDAAGTSGYVAADYLAAA